MIGEAWSACRRASAHLRLTRSVSHPPTSQRPPFNSTATSRSQGSR